MENLSLAIFRLDSDYGQQRQPNQQGGKVPFSFQDKMARAQVSQCHSSGSTTVSNHSFLLKEMDFRKEENKLGIQFENGLVSHYTPSSRSKSSPEVPRLKQILTAWLTGKERWAVILGLRREKTLCPFCYRTPDIRTNRKAVKSGLSEPYGNTACFTRLPQTQVLCPPPRTVTH